MTNPSLSPSAQDAATADAPTGKFTQLLGPLLLIDVLAAVVGFMPALFLAFGIQAIGAVNGWWIGDPNSNDGEEGFATALGGGGVLLVLVATIVAVTWAANRKRIPALVINVINSAVLITVYAVVMIVLFT